MDVYIGFDSAWVDKPKAPGAICAISMEDGRPVHFHAPQLVSFDQSLTFIQKVRSVNGVTLIALDQPTVVPNLTGMRPVERVAASLASWLGAGVQPSNRGKLGMFCDASPIWRFLTALGAEQNPEHACVATDGLHLIEVFPALALASLDSGFFGRLKAPKYNPANRKKFNRAAWERVIDATAREARSLGCEELAEWFGSRREITQPRKGDQDMLDAGICALIAIRWRRPPREASLLLGDTNSGYMVLPASSEVRDYFAVRAVQLARKHLVAIDGVIPTW